MPTQAPVRMPVRHFAKGDRLFVQGPKSLPFRIAVHATRNTTRYGSTPLAPLGFKRATMVLNQDLYEHADFSLEVQGMFEKITVTISSYSR